MDEICVAIWFGRVSVADLVTEMKEVVRYYSKGGLARDGIERSAGNRS